MYKPKEIYQFYQNSYLSRISALDLLLYLIDSSNDEILRVESLKYINRINPQRKEIFEFLENLFISEVKESVRFAAFKVLKKNFPVQAIKPIKHAISNETGLFLIPLIEFLSQVNPFECYKVIIDRIRNDNEISIHITNKRDNLKRLSLKQLKTLFYNYLLNKSLESLYFHRHQIPLALDFYGIDDV